MSRPSHKKIAALAVCLLAPLFANSARASERVTLRNGFTVDCNHHAALGERIRLFTSADESSYQEIASEQIAGFETVPDPPVKLTATAAITKPYSEPTTAEMRHLLESAGAAHNVDVELLASVVKAESAFNTHAVSRTGARGLMQLMPGTAQQLRVQDAFRADQNIAGGTAYLDSLLKMYKDNLALALAAYNAGPGAVARYHGVPPFRETRAYVSRVINEFVRRKRALAASTAMATP